MSKATLLLVLIFGFFFNLTAQSKTSVPDSLVFAKGSPEWIFEASFNAFINEKFEEYFSFYALSELNAFKELLDKLYAESKDKNILKEIKDLAPEIKSTEEFINLPVFKIIAVLYKYILTKSPAASSMAKTMKVKAIGHILDGENTALVITKTSYEYNGKTYTQYDMNTLTKENGEWRMCLKQGTMNSFKMALEK